MVKARPWVVPPAGRRRRPSPRGDDIPEVGCLALGVAPPIVAHTRCDLKEFGAQSKRESDADVTGFTAANDLSIDPPGFRDSFEQQTEPAANCDQPARADQAAAGTDVEELCRRQPLVHFIHDQYVCSCSPRGRPRRAASLNCDCHGESVPPARTKLEMIEDPRRPRIIERVRWGVGSLRSSIANVDKASSTTRGSMAPIVGGGRSRCSQEGVCLPALPRLGPYRLGHVPPRDPALGDQSRPGGRELLLVNACRNRCSSASRATTSGWRTSPLPRMWLSGS